VGERERSAGREHILSVQSAVKKKRGRRRWTSASAAQTENTVLKEIKLGMPPDA
jgi:hypothetical protein